MPRPAGDPLRLTAKRHVSAAPGGGSGAQVYEVIEDPNLYIVKFRGNNQGVRVVFNEYVSGRIGEFIGAPFGDHALIEVSDGLHPPNGTQHITARMPGVQFATTYYSNNAQTDMAQLKAATNFQSHFPAVLVFDTLIARGDGRQYVVYSSPHAQNGQRDTGVIFDHGFAFTGSPGWTVATLTANNNCQANNGLGLKNDLGGIETYAPFLDAVENLSQDDLRLIVHEPPLQEWGVGEDEATALVNWLNTRKGQVRAAIQAYL
jgi:HipA-like kinase